MSFHKEKNPLVAEAITIVGRQQDLADAIGVAQQTVSKLLLGEIPLKAEWAVSIEEATNGRISRAALRPDIFPAPSQQEVA